MKLVTDSERYEELRNSVTNGNSMGKLYLQARADNGTPVRSVNGKTKKQMFECWKTTHLTHPDGKAWNDPSHFASSHIVIEDKVGCQ